MLKAIEAGQPLKGALRHPPPGQFYLSLLRCYLPVQSGLTEQV